VGKLRRLRSVRPPSPTLLPFPKLVSFDSESKSDFRRQNGLVADSVLRALVRKDGLGVIVIQVPNQNCYQVPNTIGTPLLGHSTFSWITGCVRDGNVLDSLKTGSE